MHYFFDILSIKGLINIFIISNPTSMINNNNNREIVFRSFRDITSTNININKITKINPIMFFKYFI